MSGRPSSGNRRQRGTLVGAGVALSIVLPLALGVALLVLPLVALALRVPWSEALTLLTEPEVRAALRVSLVSSLLAAGLAALTGVPLAWLLARRSFRGRTLLRVACLLPMVLPPVVAGVALLYAFGRRGLVGGPVADSTGFAFPFHLAGVVLAGAFVALPFVVVAVEAGLRNLDRRFEDAAATLGAGPAQRLRWVTLPLLGPSLAAGLGLGWARALGEFGATITFAGNLPGRTQTLPLAVYVWLERDPAVAGLLSFLLLGVSALVLLALGGRLSGR